MKIRFVFFILVLGLSLTSCSYNYIGKSDPISISMESCYDIEKQNIQYHNYLALLQTFKARRWMLKSINQDEKTIIAEACRGRYCLEVIATVKTDGEIQISRTNDDEISRRGASLLKRWLTLLERTYTTNRCNSTKHLIEQTAEFIVNDELRS